MLTGNVTPAYITHLMQEEKQTSELNQQQAALYPKEGNTKAAQAYSSFSDPISTSVLQEALNFLDGATTANSTA